MEALPLFLSHSSDTYMSEDYGHNYTHSTCNSLTSDKPERMRHLIKPANKVVIDSLTLAFSALEWALNRS